MKKIFLALACFGMLLATAACGGGEMKKDVTVNKEILGDGAMVFQHVLSVEETGATLSVVSDESGAISQQDFTVEVPVTVNGNISAEIMAIFQEILPEITLTVFDEAGKEIPGLKDFEFDKECIKALDESCSAGNVGILVFKTINNARNEYKERFENAASVQLTVNGGSNSSKVKSATGGMNTGYGAYPYENPADMNVGEMNPADEASEDEAPEDGVMAY